MSLAFTSEGIAGDKEESKREGQIWRQEKGEGGSGRRHLSLFSTYLEYLSSSAVSDAVDEEEEGCEFPAVVAPLLPLRRDITTHYQLSAQPAMACR